MIPADRWETLIERERHPPRVFNLFPGGIQVEPGVNAVQPNFFHLYPVWLGTAEMVGGPQAAYRVSPLWGVVAAAMFWLLARQLTSPLVATLASALLLANFAQIWFARVPTTEVMTEALLLAGTLFLIALHRGAPPVVGALAGAAFGLAAFTRIDVIVLVLPIVIVAGAAVWIDRRWHQGWTWCAAALAVLSGHAVAHAWLVSSLYSERIIFHMFFGRGVGALSRVVPPLLLASAVAAFLAARWLRGSALAARVPWIAFSLLLAGAAVRIAPQVVGGPLAILLTPPGIVLVLVAIAVWLYDDRSWPALLVAALLLLSMLVYGESARERAPMPMPLRRYVPVVLPLAVLAIGMLVERLWTRGAMWRVAAVSVWTALAVLWGSDGRRVAAIAPMQHMHQEVGRLAAAMPAEALIVADRSSPSHLALSLWGSFRRDVVFVKPTPETAEALRTLSQSSRRPLVLMKGVGPVGLGARDIAGLTLSPRRVETLHLTPFEATSDRLPRVLSPQDVPIDLYDARAADPPALPLLVEVGDGDLAIAVDGLHGSEQMGTAHARWSGAVAQLLLPRVTASGEGLLTLRVAAPRPAGLERPRLGLRLDGQAIGDTAPIGAEFMEVAVPLSADTVQQLSRRTAILTLTAPTFVPAEHGMGDDRRPLGVAVDWVRLSLR